MQTRQTLPDLWLLSDQRNDTVLAAALRALQPGSAFIYRHYHLPASQRKARFLYLARIARMHGHLVIVSGSPTMAKRWGADGYYSPARRLGPTRRDMIAITAAHDMAELAQANLSRADAVLLSPVFPTRSHPGKSTLGPLRFRLIARHAAMPVIALGGMNPANAKRLGWPRWAAIDGLSSSITRRDS